MDYFELSCGDLAAKVLTPESGLYHRTRFAHTGIVQELSCRGHVFTRPEQIDPAAASTGGLGLSGAYVFDESEQQARPGEDFLRLGIGRIIRQEKPTSFMRDPAYVPLNTRCEATRERVRFETESEEIGGFAYRETRVIALSDACLTQTVEFTNTGARPIHGYEYNHNFVTVDDAPISAEYTLEIPCLADIGGELARAERKPALCCINGALTWPESPVFPFHFVFRQTRKPESFAWRLSRRGGAATLTETCDFTPERVVVWGMAHCASAEVYKEFDLQSGESCFWTRIWTPFVG